MKILTKKKQDELLKLITACQIMIVGKDLDIEIFSKLTDNFSEVCYLIGGVEGGYKVYNTVGKFLEEKNK